MRCKLCKSKFLNNINLDKKYYHCQECDLIFLEDQEILNPKQERQRYLEHNNTLENKGYVNMFKKLINKVIKPYKRNINHVLDFGCGPGPVLAHLLKKDGFKVDIYDPFFYPDKVYKGNKYDLITSTEVFEHLKDPYSVIKTIVKHLSKNGYLAVMTSFHPGPKKFKNWWYKKDPTHITFFSSTTFDWIADRFLLKKVYVNNQKYCLFKKLQ